MITWKESIGFLRQSAGAAPALAGGGPPCGLLDDPAYMWNPDEAVTIVGSLPGGAFCSATAYGINDFGEVVGLSDTPKGNSEAFYWSDATGIIGLGDLPGGNFSSTAKGINNAGTVVGYGTIDGAASYAFTWTLKGGMQPMPALPVSGKPIHANAINELGEICGLASGNQAFLWEPGSGYALLGKLPGTLPLGGTGALALNEMGQVVGSGLWGYTFPPPYPKSDYFAWVWDAQHGIRNLDDLVDASTRAVPDALPLIAARGINNAGQIICISYWLVEAYVLQPFIPGDCNCDGMVDKADVAACAQFIADFSPTVADPNTPVTSYCGWWTADLNQDAVLNDGDLGILLAKYGTACP